MPKVNESEKNLLKKVHEAIVAGNLEQVRKLVPDIKDWDRTYW